MTNIVKFPGMKRPIPELRAETQHQAAKPESTPALLKVIWVVTVLTWPVLKWIISFDCLYQMLRMMYHWNTPGTYAGFNFLLHFAVFVALTYYVSLYKPKGL
jgi:hypothetical protein